MTSVLLICCCSVWPVASRSLLSLAGEPGFSILPVLLGHELLLASQVTQDLGWVNARAEPTSTLTWPSWPPGTDFLRWVLQVDQLFLQAFGCTSRPAPARPGSPSTSRGRLKSVSTLKCRAGSLSFLVWKSSQPGGQCRSAGQSWSSQWRHQATVPRLPDGLVVVVVVAGGSRIFTSGSPLAPPGHTPCPGGRPGGC